MHQSMNDMESRMDSHDLTASETQALRDVARGRLMQRKISAADCERLLELGYVERRFGGIQATAEGHRYVVAHPA